MANWTGCTRTNYFTLVPETADLFRKRMEALDIRICDPKGDGRICIYPGQDGDGGWPTFGFGPPNFASSPTPPDEDQAEELPDPLEAEIDFCFEAEIIPFVLPGEVVVYQIIGHEKVCYVEGRAKAFVRTESGEVRDCFLSLDDIYKKAAHTFQVPIETITTAEY
jgi:hypothetical protein